MTPNDRDIELQKAMDRLKQMFADHGFQLMIPGAPGMPPKPAPDVPTYPSLVAAQVIPFDQSRRKSKLDRQARKKWDEKRRQREARKAHNEKVIRQLKAEKGRE